MYVRVYSLNGEAFDVNRHVADDLILQRGWTQTPPTFVKKEEPEPQAEVAPRKKKKKKAAGLMPVDEAIIAAVVEQSDWRHSDE